MTARCAGFCYNETKIPWNRETYPKIIWPEFPAVQEVHTKMSEKLSACGEKAPWLPDHWDDEADIIVVGYGGAGVIAAITAKYEGASCIVLEKSAEADGGNTAVSGGHIHTAVGVDVDESAATAPMEPPRLRPSAPPWSMPRIRPPGLPSMA